MKGRQTAIGLRKAPVTRPHLGSPVCTLHPPSLTTRPDAPVLPAQPHLLQEASIDRILKHIVNIRQTLREQAPQFLDVGTDTHLGAVLVLGLKVGTGSLF